MLKLMLIVGVLGQVGAPTPGPVKMGFYCDPMNGSTTSGDGSWDRPWGTLQSIIEAKLINGQDATNGAVHAGDAIYLRDGDHGSVTLSVPANGKYRNTDFIMVQGLNDERPVLHQINLIGGSNWVFRNLTVVCPEVVPDHYYLISAQNVTNVIIDNCTTYSRDDVSQWTAKEWGSLAASRGIAVKGSGVTVKGCTMRNLTAGAYVEGNNIVFVDNVIDCFSGDGLDFNGFDLLIARNRVTNHSSLGDLTNHNDGIQGYILDRSIVGANVIIDSNVVLASDGKYPFIPLLQTGVGADYMQGITIFDGAWRNVSIVNNVVVCSGYHGISLYGASDSLIVNNTLVSQSAPDAVGTPSIRVAARKDGTLSTNVVVRNNVGRSYNVQKGLTFDHNLSFKDVLPPYTAGASTVRPEDVFMNSDVGKAGFDLSLKRGSKALGAGSSQGAPLLDVLGRSRGVDAGAYQGVR